MSLIKAKRYHCGLNTVTDRESTPKAEMDFRVLLLNSGMKQNLLFDGECALLLIAGKAELKWNGNVKKIERKSCFHDAPMCLDVPADVKIEVTAEADNTQFAVMTTDNGRTFEPHFYTQEECPNENRGAGTLNECGTRIVRSVLSRNTCKETNFVMGEVVNSPGKWSSFPPHSHPQPEIYYYRFLPDDGNGFGFSEDGYDTAHVVREGDALLAVDGDIHGQVTAPGYAMYYIWVIRDSDLNPYYLPPSVPQYGWMTEKDAKFFPDI